ncbi:MAG: hypothetical protein ACKV22_09735 [Bryobacteraceae bacterium]
MQERDIDIQELERAARTAFEQDETWWIGFITQYLRLPLAFEPAVRLALETAGWRSARAPRKYVRSTSWRIARREELVDRSERFRPPTITELSRRNMSGKMESLGETCDRLIQKAIRKAGRFDNDEQLGIVEVFRMMDVDIPWGRILQRVDSGGSTSDNELSAYVLDRLLGIRGNSHSEAVRKRFQRVAPILADAVIDEFKRAEFDHPSRHKKKAA